MPASLFIDADGDDIIFCLVHRFDDISRRYERNLVLGGLAAEQDCDAQFFFHWAFFETGWRIQDGRSRIENRGWRIDLRFAIFDSRLSCVSLRLLGDRRRRLLFDDFHDLAGIGLFFELQNEVFGFDWIALAVKLDGARHTFEVFDLAHRNGDIGAARLLAAVGFDPLFHRLDADQRGVVAVHAEGFGVFAEALFVFFGEGGGFGISIRRTGDAGVVAVYYRAPGDLRHFRRIETIGSHKLGVDAFFA